MAELCAVVCMHVEVMMPAEGATCQGGWHRLLLHTVINLYIPVDIMSAGFALRHWGCIPVYVSRCPICPSCTFCT